MSSPALEYLRGSFANRLAASNKGLSLAQQDRNIQKSSSDSNNDIESNLDADEEIRSITQSLAFVTAQEQSRADPPRFTGNFLSRAEEEEIHFPNGNRLVRRVSPQGDAQIGQGTMTYANGHVLHGIFQNCVPAGRGTYIDPDRENPSTLYGNFSIQNGALHCVGKKVFANGDMLECIFIDCMANGFGTYRYSDNDRVAMLSGRFTEQKGKLYCSGIQTFTNNSEIQGEFLNGQLQKVTQIMLSNGIICRGTFRSGLPLDKALMWGTVTHSNGKQYKGQFEQGRLTRGTVMFQGNITYV